MKFPKTKMKNSETQFENAKTQFENAKTQFTGDLLAWTGRAMRSKKSPAMLHGFFDSPIVFLQSWNTY